MNIGDRLKEIRKKIGLSQIEFADMLGISKDSMSLYESNKKIPSGKLLIEICSKTGYSPSWVLMGKDNSRCNEYEATDIDILQIPLVSAVLSAGTGSFDTSANIEKYLMFRSDFLYRKGQPSQMVLMRVSGDSMHPEIQDNDVVLIDQSQKELLANKVYAVAFGDMIYLKKVNAYPDRLVLESLNPYYAPIIIENFEAEQVRIIGKVIWWCREVL